MRVSVPGLLDGLKAERVRSWTREKESGGKGEQRWEVPQAIRQRGWPAARPGPPREGRSDDRRARRRPDLTQQHVRGQDACGPQLVLNPKVGGQPGAVAGVGLDACTHRCHSREASQRLQALLQASAAQQSPVPLPSVLDLQVPGLSSSHHREQRAFPRGL